MDQPFNIVFQSHLRARAVRLRSAADLPHLHAALGIESPQPAVVLIGGAGGMDETDLAHLRPLFTRALAPIAHTLGAAIIDGGTDSGVMRLMGEARAEGGYHFPLIGVAVETLVTWPGGPQRAEPVALESHHTHFILVPGSDWGDESPWISDVASTLSGTAGSVTVLINGGEVARQDVEESMRVGRPVIVVAGSGRLADELAGAHSRGSLEDLIGHTGALQRVQVVNGSDAPAQLASAVEQCLITRKE